MKITKKQIGFWLTVFGVILGAISLLKISSSTEISTYGDQSPAIQADTVQINYENKKDPSIINNRIDELKGLEPEEIAEEYYDFLNNNKLRDVCSLMPKIKCDISNGEQVQDLQKEVSKHVNGYENVEIWDPEIEENKSKIICSKYSYILKTDSNPQRIWEIMAFYFDKREDGEWEITTRACEKKFKEGLGERNCPYPTSVKYCTN